MKNRIFKIIITALFTAIVCVATFAVQIPIAVTGGYINIGDAFVLLSGVVLGPFYGFIAAGLGSMLADILFGYFIYAPATFIIKGLMALVISILFIKNKEKYRIGELFLFGFVAELIMVLGYFAYECFCLSYGLGAALAIPSNAVQGVCGIIANTVIVKIINKNLKLKNLLNWRE